MFIRLLVGPLIFFLLASTSYPQQVEMHDALDVANKFIEFNRKGSTSPDGLDFSIINSSVRSHNHSSVYYVFQMEPEGFIIISGDFRAIPILAFSFNSRIDIITDALIIDCY